MNTTIRKPAPPTRAARRRRQRRSRDFDTARWSLRRIQDPEILPDRIRIERRFIRGLNLIHRFRSIL